MFEIIMLHGGGRSAKSTILVHRLIHKYVTYLSVIIQFPILRYSVKFENKFECVIYYNIIVLLMGRTRPTFRQLRLE